MEPVTSRVKMTTVKIKHIQRIVAAHYDIKPGDITSKSRMTLHVAPRWVAMYLCRSLTDASYSGIGRDFGGRDHSSVMTAVDKINERLKKDQKLYQTIETLKTLISGERQKKEQDLYRQLSDRIMAFDQCLDDFKAALKPLIKASGLIKDLTSIISDIKVSHGE